MIDESKICEAASAYQEEDGRPFTEVAFQDGAQWAQQEFIKTLWHDASEEPKTECHIVAQIVNSISNKPYYETMQKSLIYEWEYVVKCNGITKWAYVDDILPKEVGEQWMGNADTWTSVKDELPPLDEEVIVLDIYERISFGHIVDPEEAISYDGWNIPSVVFWRPCGYTQEMFDYYGYKELEGGEG